MSLTEGVSFLNSPLHRREVVVDYSSEASLKFQRALQEKIRDFWAKKGYTKIEFRLSYTHFDAKMRSGRYDLRSNMKNALPIDWKKT